MKNNIKEQIHRTNALLEDYDFKPFMSRDGYYSRVNGKEIVITGHEIRRLEYDREKIIDLIKAKWATTY